MVYLMYSIHTKFESSIVVFMPDIPRRNMLLATLHKRFRVLGSNVFLKKQLPSEAMEENEEVMVDMHTFPVLTCISIVWQVLKGNCITENMSRNGSCH